MQTSDDQASAFLDDACRLVRSQRGFVALGVPLGAPEFMAAFLETLLANREPSLTVYYSLPTLRLHGCCCLSVRPLVRSTRCAHCHLQTHEHTPLDMMPPSSLAWIPCCMLTLLPACLLWLPHVHSSRCATVDLDSAAPSAMPSRRFGHLGPTRSQPSRVETVPSLKPSRVLWMAPGLCLTPWLP